MKSGTLLKNKINSVQVSIWQIDDCYLIVFYFENITAYIGRQKWDGNFIYEVDGAKISSEAFSSYEELKKYLMEKIELSFPLKIENKCFIDSSTKITKGNDLRLLAKMQHESNYDYTSLIINNKDYENN